MTQAEQSAPKPFDPVEIAAGLHARIDAAQNRMAAAQRDMAFAQDRLTNLEAMVDPTSPESTTEYLFSQDALDKMRYYDSPEGRYEPIPYLSFLSGSRAAHYYQSLDEAKKEAQKVEDSSLADLNYRLAIAEEIGDRTTVEDLQDIITSKVAKIATLTVQTAAEGQNEKPLKTYHDNGRSDRPHILPDSTATGKVIEPGEGLLALLEKRRERAKQLPSWDPANGVIIAPASRIPKSKREQLESPEDTPSDPTPEPASTAASNESTPDTGPTNTDKPAETESEQTVDSGPNSSTASDNNASDKPAEPSEANPEGPAETPPAVSETEAEGQETPKAEPNTPDNAPDPSDSGDQSPEPEPQPQTAAPDTTQADPNASAPAPDIQADPTSAQPNVAPADPEKKPVLKKVLKFLGKAAVDTEKLIAKGVKRASKKSSTTQSSSDTPSSVNSKSSKMDKLVKRLDDATEKVADKDTRPAKARRLAATALYNGLVFPYIVMLENMEARPKSYALDKRQSAQAGS